MEHFNITTRALEHLQPCPPKVIGTHRTNFRSQPRIKASFRRLNTVSGVPRPPPSTGDARGTPDTTKNETGSHLSVTTFITVGSRLLFLVAPSLPRLSPLRRCLICRPFQRHISSESGTVVAAGSLAGLFAAAASLAHPRTRRQIHPRRDWHKML
jgi:hypothetical protein